jgi:uncharacterized membrane protein YhaH (DUF805 family)
MTTKEILFSFSGRINRSTYVKYWLMLSGFVVAGLLLDLATNGGIFWIITGLAQTWSNLAIFAKRMHDRDRSPWIGLLTFIPFVGILVLVWLLIEVFGLKGTDGPNRFDDKDEAADLNDEAPCPHCGETAVLNSDERVAGGFVCPWCQQHVELMTAPGRPTSP